MQIGSWWAEKREEWGGIAEWGRILFRAREVFWD